MRKQQSLFANPRSNTKRWWIINQKVYGGSLNYRKIERPFDSRQLVHVVLKANLSHGIYFTRSVKFIESLLKTSTKRYGLGLKDFAINQDHLHLLVWASKRESFIKFLRFFSAEMGRRYKASYARHRIKRAQSLWAHRPFSRLVSWGKRSVARIQAYIKKNKDEALGFIAYAPRRHRLKEFLARWAAGHAPDNLAPSSA